MNLLDTDSFGEREIDGGAVLDGQSILTSRASAESGRLPDLSDLSVTELLDTEAALVRDASRLRAAANAKDVLRGGVVLEWYSRARAEILKALNTGSAGAEKLRQNINDLRFTNVNFGSSPEGEKMAILHFPKVQILGGVSVDLGVLFEGVLGFRVGWDEIVCSLPLARFERSAEGELNLNGDGCGFARAVQLQVGSVLRTD